MFFFSKRLLALATQKFAADIATDAFQYCKVRQSGNRKIGKVKGKMETAFMKVIEINKCNKIGA
jgi:hypothetical protein